MLGPQPAAHKQRCLSEPSPRQPPRPSHSVSFPVIPAASTAWVGQPRGYPRAQGPKGPTVSGPGRPGPGGRRMAPPRQVQSVQACFTRARPARPVALEAVRPGGGAGPSALLLVVAEPAMADVASRSRRRCTGFLASPIRTGFAERPSLIESSRLGFQSN